MTKLIFVKSLIALTISAVVVISLTTLIVASLMTINSPVVTVIGCLLAWPLLIVLTFKIVPIIFRKAVK